MRILTQFTALALIAALSATAIHAKECPLSKAKHQAQQVVHHTSNVPDIVDTAVAAEGFDTLVAAVKAAGLVDTLKSKGPFTVFVPTDEAFAKLPEGTVEGLLKPENKKQLAAILTYHVVPGRLDAAHVVKLAAAQTVQGASVRINAEHGKVMIDKATVLKADIGTSNGVIHVIDSVLMPPKQHEQGSAKKAESHAAKQAAADIVDVAASAGSFNTLVAAVKAAGLVETLKGEGPFTVFAPTDEAFAKLPKGTVESLLQPENKDQLVKILTYHVVAGKVLAADVVKLSHAKTVQGSEVSIETNNGNVMIDGAKVLKTDIGASNGVIHVIDSVIMP